IHSNALPPNVELGELVLDATGAIVNAPSQRTIDRALRRYDAVSRLGFRNRVLAIALLAVVAIVLWGGVRFLQLEGQFSTLSVSVESLRQQNNTLQGMATETQAVLAGTLTSLGTAAYTQREFAAAEDYFRRAL